ncbi:hypothetical protein F5H01DRAFT_83524 [Linnemannia elongata]|nr:hypothetical protein F5H01DRAFT_83524 [Linnemannia elongata]
MNNHGRDESTVIDLSVINPRSRPEQYTPPLRSPPVITSPTVSSPNIFNHLSLLDSNDPSSPIVGTPSSGSGTGVGNNNNSNNNANNQNHLSKGQAKGGAGGGGGGHGGSGHHETKECPRHAEGHPPNRLTTRDLGNNRTVYLFFGSDVVLFDTIMTYRLGKPDMLVEDAIDAHGKILLRNYHRSLEREEAFFIKLVGIMRQIPPVSFQRKQPTTTIK